METTIKDETGLMIGVITHPANTNNWFAHSIHIQSSRGRKFHRKWEAANWLHAIHDNAREITTGDLVAAAGTITPLAKTASEKIARLRNWAEGRARPASLRESETVASNGPARSIDL